jgi:hypothetical protein
MTSCTRATINYVDQNGQQIDSSLLNNAATTLSGIVGENLAITSPKITGYTAYADNPSRILSLLMKQPSRYAMLKQQ